MHFTASYRACIALLSWASLAGCAQGSDRPAHWQGTSPARPGYVAPRSPDLLRSDMLRMHNQARRDVGAPSLRWDDALASEATGYARELARKRRFEHSRQQDRSSPQGENLWQGTLRDYAYAEMAGHWIGEKPYYDGSDMSAAVAGTAGHYTQIIWANTTHVGCGMAANRTHEVLVCRYSPPGNVIGQKPGG